MMNTLFDSKLSNLAISSYSFVDLAISTTTNEAYDLVAIMDAVLAPVVHRHDSRVWRV